MFGAEGTALCPLTDFNVFLSACPCDGKEVLADVKPVELLEAFFFFFKLSFYFMTCPEGMGSALGLFAFCPSCPSCKENSKTLQIPELGLDRREPGTESF